VTCHEDGLRASIELRGVQGGALRKDVQCEAAVESELKVCLAGWHLLTGQKASAAGAAAVTTKEAKEWHEGAIGQQQFLTCGGEGCCMSCMSCMYGSERDDRNDDEAEKERNAGRTGQSRQQIDGDIEGGSAAADAADVVVVVVVEVR
jgi:hypothetical protein